MRLLVTATIFPVGKTDLVLQKGPDVFQQEPISSTDPSPFRGTLVPPLLAIPDMAQSVKWAFGIPIRLQVSQMPLAGDVFLGAYRMDHCRILPPFAATATSSGSAIIFNPENYCTTGT